MCDLVTGGNGSSVERSGEESLSTRSALAMGIARKRSTIDCLEIFEVQDWRNV